MKISLAWLNSYLAPADLTPDQAEDLLMHVGFPIESRETLPAGDTLLDVEVTSNRGDCLSHVGLAREIAVKTGRSLVMPTADLPPPAPGAGRVEDLVAIDNTCHDLCPMFTIRVIRGVKVGPSPEWLARAIESIGQRPISNVVDATNYVNFELGNPSHVFDLSRLAGPRIIIRRARHDEPLTTLDGKKRLLTTDDLVVADQGTAQGLAGVIGGADTQVTERTTDVLIEVATWSPSAVRSASRRHAVRTDSSHRYERIVDQRSLDFASRRLASIILATAGGLLCEGVLSAGSPPPSQRPIRLRTSRCTALIGVEIPPAQVEGTLRGLGIATEAAPSSGGEQGALTCIPPHWRPDLTREVDLIEEVARVAGLDRIPVSPKVSVVVHPPNPRELALRELAAILVGMNFYETVTFSFVRPTHAEPFLAPGLRELRVDDERRGAEPTLRPSILPSLLACRRKNQDGDVVIPGGVRLFEFGPTFSQEIPRDPASRGEVIQPRTFAMLMDVTGSGTAGKRTSDEVQSAIRAMRGVIESVIRALGGTRPSIEVAPADPPYPAWRTDAVARILVDGLAIGHFGVVSDQTTSAYGIECPVVAAEVLAAPLLDLFPPRTSVRPLPEFPAVERDLTLIVPENVRWAAVESLVREAAPERFESLAYVGAYRGKQVGDGKKSLTMRLWFRDAHRTLRREEVDPEIDSLVRLAGQRLGALVRTS
ncbi:MAG: phenylalanine--tRNA ligase subunit beta [Phycisphaeraceae bacterium]|nr:phenylalanine--tRNA ligase subunit beta [Phycisphaerae bacterium]MBX3391235.1 phenylalanine--tRNA ligase subunit beta [Phycisphaeraceae bacterium]